MTTRQVTYFEFQVASLKGADRTIAVRAPNEGAARMKALRLIDDGESVTEFRESVSHDLPSSHPQTEDATKARVGEICSRWGYPLLPSDAVE